MRTALVFGVTFAAGALFFACAKGDDAVTPGGGGGDDDVEQDGSTQDGAHDGNTSYVTDSGNSDSSSPSTDAGVDSGPACVETDAGCTTTDPGLCSEGIIHCDDAGAAVCVPITTTESCYSGPGAARNIGVCHDGTQSCIGSIGACEGEVDPAPAENCFNDLDDDCNGLVNDGCPTSIVLGASRDLTAEGGGGGSPSSVLCAANEFVSRADFYFDHSDSHASGIAIYCAAASLVQGVSSYSVTLAAATPAPYTSVLGSHTTTPYDDHLDCGIGSLTAMTWLVGQTDTYVEGFKSYCGNGTMTLNANNTLSFDFARVGAGNFLTYGTGTDFETDCNSNEVIVGFNVHSGLWMDNIQAICAPMTATYSAGTPDP
jgi:hypothetical protein